MIGRLAMMGRAILLVAGMIGLFSRGQHHRAYAATAIDAPTKQRILSATVRIVFYALSLDEDGQPQITMANDLQEDPYVTFERTDGLGTLVNLNGETVIVTHDHWSLQDRLKLARFYDASGILLAEVYGDEFRQLIRYRDGGTMILALPTQVAGAAVSGYGQMVRPEDVIYLACRMPNSDRLDVVPMRVTAVYAHGGPEMLALVSLDGRAVEQGNSGAGLWYQGQLVGNLWSTVKERYVFQDQSSALKGTDRSVAALLPVEAQSQTDNGRAQTPRRRLSHEFAENRR